ncbi:MAG: hypothetical protein IJ367_05130, partial [Clostridia bacterium]|nr:hypothetical protein [Clostridia bacterium]
KQELRTYSQFFIRMQAAIGGILIISGLFFQNADYRFLLVMLGVDMIAINLTSYYQFLSQATKRFSEYSLKNLILSLAKALLILVLLGLKYTLIPEIPYQVYLICLVALDVGMLVWYLLIYKDITFGEKAPLSQHKTQIIALFRSGIVLTVAYQVSHLVHMLDRQFVSILFPVAIYGVYAFAYNLITLISTMVSSLSIVMFPMLKRASRDLLCVHYETMLSGVAALIGLSLVCYCPLAWFIRWFLPEYSQSLQYLKIILPSILFTGTISVVMFTFVKILNQNSTYFKNSCIVLAIGFVTNWLAYRWFRTPEAISYASLITMAIWFLLEGIHLKRAISVPFGKAFFYVCALTASFLATMSILPGDFAGCIGYFLCYILLTFLCYKTNFSSWFSFFRKK